MRGLYLLHLSLLLFLNQTIGNGQFGWTVQHRVFQYGDNLTLICVVGGCCTQKAGWGKWIPDFTTIFIDVKGLNVSPNFKYDAQIVRNGFTLVIRQFNETDLNIPYSCTYGFEFSAKKFLIKSLAFKVKDDVGRSKKGEGYRRAIKYLLAIILPTLCFCVVIGLAMVLLKVCKSNNKGVMLKKTKKVIDDSLGSTKYILPLNSQLRNELPDVQRNLLDGSVRIGETSVTSPISIPQRNERIVPMSSQSSGASINIHFSSARESPDSAHGRCNIYFRAGTPISDLNLFFDQTDEEEPIDITCNNHKNDTGDGSTSKNT